MGKKIIFAGILVAFLFSACKKETEEYKSTTISDYAPLQVGKYITYQLDSFRYLPQSLVSLVISYQVKYAIDAEVTDNNGRPAFRVIRYIRNNSTQPWTPDNTFMAVNTGNTFEFIENNLRYIKLKQPFNDSYSWKGNSFIATTSQNIDIRYLDNWDYIYDSLNLPKTIGTLNFDSTLMVNQRDEIIGNPGDPNSYSEKNYGVEYYAKGIGLIYKKFLHSEYQPPTSPGGTGSYSDATKGATFTIIDHN